MSSSVMPVLRRLFGNTFRVRPVVPSAIQTRSRHSFTDVPDARHRGIGAVDEGIDGLREAGFLNDSDACTLAASTSSKSNSSAPYSSSTDPHDVGSNNVYAIDTQYKKLALNILDMSETNNHQPNQLSSFTDQTMELAKDRTSPAVANWVRPLNPVMIRSPDVHVTPVLPLSASFNKQFKHFYTTIDSLLVTEQPEQIDFHLLLSCDNSEQSVYATKDFEDDLVAAYSDECQSSVPSLY